MNLRCLNVKVERSISYEYRKRSDILKVCQSESVQLAPVVNPGRSEVVAVNGLTLKKAIPSQRTSKSRLKRALRSKRGRTAFKSISVPSKRMESRDDVPTPKSTCSSTDATSDCDYRRTRSVTSSLKAVITTRSGPSERRCGADRNRRANPVRLSMTKGQPLTSRRVAAKDTGLPDDIWRLISAHLRVVCCESSDHRSNKGPVAAKVNLRSEKDDFNDAATRDELALDAQSCSVSSTAQGVQAKTVKAYESLSQETARLAGKSCEPTSSTKQRSKVHLRNTAVPLLSAREIADREELRCLRKRFSNDPSEYLSAAFGAASTVRCDELTRVTAAIERHKASRKPGVLARLTFFERAGDRIATLRERDRVESSEPLSRQRVSSECSETANDLLKKSEQSVSHTAVYPPAYVGSTFPIRDCVVSLCSLPISAGTKRVRLMQRGGASCLFDKPCWHPKLHLEPLKMTSHSETSLQAAQTSSHAVCNNQTALRSNCLTRPVRMRAKFAKNGRPFAQLQRASPQRLLGCSLHSP